VIVAVVAAVRPFLWIGSESDWNLFLLRARANDCCGARTLLPGVLAAAPIRVLLPLRGLLRISLRPAAVLWGSPSVRVPSPRSTPTSVVHTAHAGIDSVTGGLAHRDLPPEWRSLFNNAQQALLQSKAAAAAAAAGGPQASPSSSNRSDTSPYLCSSPLADGGSQSRASHIWGHGSTTSSP
jgi:hypothetical protein